MRNNSAGSYGGAISVTDCDAGSQFQDAVLEGNSARGGGAIFASALQQPSVLTCSACQLHRNQAIVEDGGAVLAKDQVTLRLLGSSLEGNTGGRHGGSVACTNCVAVVADGVSVIDSEAAGMGGAIFMQRCGNSSLQRLHVRECSAAGGGGAMAVVQNAGALTVSDAMLSGNAAGTRESSMEPSEAADWKDPGRRPCSLGDAAGGGAMCLLMSADVRLRSVELLENTALYGGAIFATVEPICQRTQGDGGSSSACNIHLRNVTSDDDTAWLAGSVLYMDAKVASRFRNCSVAATGGDGDDDHCNGITFKGEPVDGGASSVMAGPVAKLQPVLEAPDWGVSATDLLNLSVRFEVR